MTAGEGDRSEEAGRFVTHLYAVDQEVGLIDIGDPAAEGESDVDGPTLTRGQDVRLASA
jgi:hypothetical protein